MLPVETYVKYKDSVNRLKVMGWGNKYHVNNN